MKMSKNPAKYEVLIKQYLRSILDISGHVSEAKPNGPDPWPLRAKGLIV